MELARKGSLLNVSQVKSEGIASPTRFPIKRLSSVEDSSSIIVPLLILRLLLPLTFLAFSRPCTLDVRILYHAV